MTIKKSILQRGIVVCLIASLCNLLWGSAFPGIKIGYQLFHIDAADTSTQILFAGLRFALAGILTIAFGSITSRYILLPGKGSFKRIAILSLFQTILQYLCFYVGLAHTTGVKASILEGANVFVAIFVAAILFRQEKLTWIKLVGSMLGFVGIVLVNVNGDASNLGLDTSFKLNGEGLILLSTVAYAVSSSFIKVYGKEDNSVMLSGYQFLFGGVVMIACGFTMGGRIPSWSIEGVAILLYLALVSAVAYTLWAILLKNNPVSKVAVYGFMNPVCGVILSRLLLREQGQAFGIKEVIALALISLGIYIVQKFGKNVGEAR